MLCFNKSFNLSSSCYYLSKYSNQEISHSSLQITQLQSDILYDNHDLYCCKFLITDTSKRPVSNTKKMFDLSEASYVELRQK